MLRDTFDAWFSNNLRRARRHNEVADGAYYFDTPGSVETIDIHTILVSLDRGLRALLKAGGHSPHQAMMHGRILPLSTDPYEAKENNEN